MTTRGVTPTYALPYPGDADIPDVPKDISALALAVDAALTTLSTGGKTDTANQIAAANKALASGTWGSGNLSDYGAGYDNRLGDEVYFDTANKLRVKPSMITSGANFKLATPPSDYPRGTTLMGISNIDAAAGGWPEGVSCFVLTFLRGGDAELSSVGGQLWFQNSATLGTYDIRYRGASGANVWGTFKQFVGDKIQSVSYTGSLTVNVTDTNDTTPFAVTFPTGLFTAPPAVMIMTSTAVPGNCALSLAEAPTATSFKGMLFRKTNVDTPVRYLAVQPY